MNILFSRATLLLATAFTLSIAQAQDKQPAFTWDKEAKISHAETVDGQYVTIQLKIADQARQLKLLRNGLEIWLDPKGKKNKNTGVKYPLPSTGGRPMGNDMNQQQAGERQRPTSPDSLNKNRQAAMVALLQEKKEIEFVGFKDAINGKHDLSFASGITVQVGLSTNDTLEYNVRIPFDALAKPVDPTKAFSIGIVLKGMQMPNFGGGGFGGGDDGPGGGEMGPPPGGAPGGMGQDGPPSMEQMQELFAENIIWIKIGGK